MDLPTLRDRVRAVRAEVLPVQPADVAYMRADQPDHAASEPRCSVMANVSDFAIVSGDVELQRFATGAGGQAVSDQPYTVAELRGWARMLLANPNFDRYPCNGHSMTRIAQAAAFDALADGIELSEQTVRLNKPSEDAYDVAYDLGRILRGEKP